MIHSKESHRPLPRPEPPGIPGADLPDVSEVLDPELLSMMTEAGRRRLRRRHHFVTLVQGGARIRDALQESKLNVTPESAIRLLRKYDAGGVLALVDRRCLHGVKGRNPRTARLPQVEALIRRAYTGGMVSPHAIREALMPAWTALGLPTPSPTTIRRVLADVRELD